MYKLFGVGSYGHALSELDSTDIFKTNVIGEYANKLVFLPPVNQQESIIRAIENLRLLDGNGCEVKPSILSQAVTFTHG